MVVFILYILFSHIYSNIFQPLT